MQRLTERLANGVIKRVEVSDGNRGDCVMSRLAAYEDTDLTPKEAKLFSNIFQDVGETYNCGYEYVKNCVFNNSLSTDIPLDRLTEVCAAEKDGRCVVLPCKVGDTVWVIINGEVWSEIVGSFSIRHGNKDFFIHSEGRDDEPEFQTYCHCEDFGKTIFLTRPEAEAALASAKQVVASTVASEVRSPGKEALNE